MSFIKASAIKKQIREKGYRVSKETFERLEDKIAAIIQAAINEATADNRKTVQPSDIV